MANIDDLLTAIMGQTDTALNAPPAPWQQELLESVNPEKVKRQNIARALAKASTAAATTPGNFLSAVSAAAATGADSYLTGRDQADDQRIKVQQLLGLQQQKDQDRRLGLLMDAFGVQNKVLDNNRADLESKAKIDYYNRRGVDSADELNANQTRLIRDSMRKALDDKRKVLIDPNNDGFFDDGLNGADLDAALAEEQSRLEAIYNLPLYARPPQSPQIVSPQKTDPAKTGGAKPIPPEVMQQAKDAIAKGADPAAIRQRLIDNGYDASGI